MSQSNVMSLRIGLIALTIGATLVFAGLWFAFYQPADSDSSARNAQQVRQELEKAHNAALHYIKSDKIPQAVTILEAVLEDHPDDANAHVLMAQALIAQKKKQQAYEHVTQALALEPSDANAEFLAGRLAQDIGNLDKARYHFTQASTIDAGNAKYPLYLASALVQMDNLDEAQVQLLRVLRLDGSLHVAYSMLAEIAARRGKIDMAIDHVNKALEQLPPTDPKTVTYTLQKSQLLRRANDPDAALSVLMQLSDSAHRRMDVTEHIADSYLMKNEPGKAAIIWTDLFNADSTNARAAAEAGLCFLRAGDERHARQYLGLAQRIDASHPTVQALEQALAAKTDTKSAG